MNTRSLFCILPRQPELLLTIHGFRSISKARLPVGWPPSENLFAMLVKSWLAIFSRKVYVACGFGMAIVTVLERICGQRIGICMPVNNLTEQTNA